MTEAQWEDLKTLCQKADVPDKSGELLTPEGAEHFIDDLKKQLAERKYAGWPKVFLITCLPKCGRRRWRSRNPRMSG